LADAAAASSDAWRASFKARADLLFALLPSFSAFFTVLGRLAAERATGRAAPVAASRASATSTASAAAMVAWRLETFDPPPITAGKVTHAPDGFPEGARKLRSPPR
jgi:hypothetical protein